MADNRMIHVTINVETREVARLIAQTHAGTRCLNSKLLKDLIEAFVAIQN